MARNAPMNFMGRATYQPWDAALARTVAFHFSYGAQHRYKLLGEEASGQLRAPGEWVRSPGPGPGIRSSGPEARTGGRSPGTGSGPRSPGPDDLGPGSGPPGRGQSQGLGARTKGSGPAQRVGGLDPKSRGPEPKVRELND